MIYKKRMKLARLLLDTSSIMITTAGILNQALVYLTHLGCLLNNMKATLQVEPSIFTSPPSFPSFFC